MATSTQKKPCRRSSRLMAKDEAKKQICVKPQEIHLTYDVLRIIFQHLSYRDLINVSQVSRFWSEAAYLEMQKRNEPIGFMEHCKTLRESLEPFLEKVLDIRIQPYISFFFVCSDTIYQHMKQPLVANTFRETQKNSIIMLHSEGVIAENLEIEGKSKHVVCAFLPKISNVSIMTFHVTKLNSAFKEGEAEFIRALQQLPPPDEKISTCLILFCNSIDNYHLVSLLNSINSCSGKISSLWGGLVRNCYIYEKTRPALKSLDCLAILITGHMKTWSTILDRKCNTKQKVEEHLKLWKQHLQLRKYSIGYMFACHARGTCWYRKQNVESSIFKSLFPDLHLVGCFGYGEFGKYTGMTKVHQTKDINKLCYTQYSTIFMILTYD
ncbi:uncharacterized protein LOC116849085 [Odontomachus brunneus]|uniref:uncharacterized protein LOC116849085 n=1 Tax=Odontomachus brunneus TaxID=486640 RepID=UPI0013F1E11B|nr:uncharacterized protein LOC116849085 [Odontomachus brunneus]